MEEERPLGVVSPNDLNALTHILSFYERWMLQTLAPSAKRSRHVSEVQFLLVKVSLLGTANAVVLTYEEVEHINYAMRTFITQMKTKMPQSQSRDDVMKNCERLRQYILTVFAPK